MQRRPPQAPKSRRRTCEDLALLTLPNFVGSIFVPDIDANADGTLDSLSAGLKLTAVPIGGVVPP